MIERKPNRNAVSFFWTVAVATALLPPAIFSVQGQDNATRDAQSIAAWHQVATVLEHPRCLNCHQENVPLQGDLRRVHIPLVVRGLDNHGVGAMRCGNCHNASGNNETSGVPGAGGKGLWQLAPRSMLWEGLSSGDLCRMLKDKARNGGRDGVSLIEHMEHEPLVLWGWDPGGDRTPVPLSREKFVDQMKVWVNAGMACPA
jgi:mono/diheme cytochrome c family protein